MFEHDQIPSTLENVIDAVPTGVAFHWLASNDRFRHIPEEPLPALTGFLLNSVYGFIFPSQTRHSLIKPSPHSQELTGCGTTMRNLGSDIAGNIAGVVLATHIPYTSALIGFAAYAGIKSVINFSQLEVGSLWKSTTNPFTRRGR